MNGHVGRRPLRVGLVGAGGIAAMHLSAFRAYPAELELVAVCDVVEESARRRADEAGIDAVYTDPYEMLRDADLDAIDICATHDQHAPIAIAAAESGRHVLVEKPMACTPKECREMVAASDQAGVTLMAGQYLRFLPTWVAAREAIRAGHLGTVRAIRIDLMTDYTTSYPLGHWIYDGKRAGGGTVISSAVHLIDIARFLVGEAASVTGTVLTTRPDRFSNGAEDYAAATIVYENGVLGQLFSSSATPAPPWQWRTTVFGDGGTIDVVGPFGPATLSTKTAGVGEPTPDEPVLVLGAPAASGEFWDVARQGFADQLLHFAECCRTGAEPLTSGRDNLRTMDTVFGIYESSRIGAPVSLSS
jgi:predicted dehydrogenase